ncbi:hypothetical protein [Ekhidna sp.]|uniref:hypothetical protein n=1 Tax=Ekhidna sp. TaxID=2608089 RepID=UPI003C7ECF8F
MQFTQSFDLTISLVLIFFLFSTVCSGVMEFINLLFKRRNNYLWNTLSKLFNEEYENGVSWAKAVYNHPQIEAFKKNKSSTGPSYIPAEVFSQVIIELTSSNLTVPKGISAETLDMERFRQFEDGVSKIDTSNQKIRQLLNSFLVSSTSLSELKLNIQKWYDGYMDRLGGWFKRDSKLILIFVSLALAIGGNINTIRLVDYFKKNDIERGKMSSLASDIINSSDSTFLNPSRDRALGTLILIDTLGLPIGWKSRKEIGLIINKYLLIKIDSLEKKRIDSLLAIEDKFCFIRSCDACQPRGGFSDEDCKSAFKCLIKGRMPNRIECDSLFARDPYRALITSYLKTKTIYKSHISSLKNIYEQSLAQFMPEEVPSNYVIKATCDYNIGGNPRERFFTYLGWIITAIAGTQGASFWFELLVRFVNIRNNGIKPSKSSG